MKTVPAKIFAPVRNAPRRRKRRAVASQVAADRVVSVVFDGTNAVIVTVEADVASIFDATLAMWVREAGGSFFTGSSADLIDATHVRVAYDDDVSACTLWMVGDPAAWVWADGGGTVAPFEGSIS
jgi:hypothetical protein